MIGCDDFFWSFVEKCFFTIVTVCNNFLWTFFEYLVILLDFLLKIDYYMNKLLDKLTEVQVMNFKKNFGWIIAIVAGTVAIASAVTAFLNSVIY